MATPIIVMIFPQGTFGDSKEPIQPGDYAHFQIVGRTGNSLIGRVVKEGRGYPLHNEYVLRPEYINLVSGNPRVLELIIATLQD